MPNSFYLKWSEQFECYDLFLGHRHVACIYVGDNIRVQFTGRPSMWEYDKVSQILKSGGYRVTTFMEGTIYANL